MYVKDTEIIFVLESEVEFDKEWVIETGKDILLPTHILNLLLANDVAFVQYLH